MNAKNSLGILIDAISELGGKVERTLLVDFVLGNATKDIKQQELHEHELFGSGDERDEEHYNMVIDEALKKKLIATKGDLLQVTAKGKKMMQDEEAEFLIKNEGEDESEEEATPNENIPTDIELDVETQQPQPEPLGANTRLKIHLIQAIDLKIALDDFAEQQNIDFHEVLDMVEALKKNGHKFDLTYFITDVLEPEDVQELNEAFEEYNGDLNAVTNEFGDVYSPEEIRLCHIQWKK